MTEQERREIEELLPFLANGTLEGDEKTRVEDALQNDASLAGELAALIAMRDTMKAEEGTESPGEFGHARLMRALEKKTPVQTAPAAAAPQTSRPIFWQIAAGVLCAALLGQAVWNSGADEGDYILAGGGEAALTVTFNPDATEDQIRNLLLDAGVEIVGGPSALGLYELAPLEDVSLDEAASVLEDNSEILESIDRVEE